MERRSNLMILLGFAFFLVGGAIVFLVLQDDDDGGTAGPGEVNVVLANELIPAGTLGQDVVDQGLVRVEQRPTGSVATDALVDPAQLVGSTVSSDIPADQAVTQAALVRDVRSVDIPEGFEGVAVRMDFLAGAGGYVRTGDLINLYGVYAECEASAVVEGASVQVPCEYNTPRAELLLTNVEVLDVDIQLAPERGTAATPQADATTDGEGVVSRSESADQVVFLLAVATEDAEKVIYQTEFERMYVTKTADDAPPAGPTQGRDFTNILGEEPDAAFQRSNQEG